MTPLPPPDFSSPRARWDRVEALFAEALAFTNVELRAAFLKEQCRQHPGLCNELASLLASDSKADHNDFLGVPIGRLGGRLQ